MSSLNYLLLVPGKILNISGTVINHGRRGDNHYIDLDDAVSETLVPAINKAFEDISINRRPKPITIALMSHLFSVTGSRRYDGQMHVAVLYLRSDRPDLKLVSGALELLNEAYTAAGFIVDVGPRQISAIISFPATKA